MKRLLVLFLVFSPVFAGSCSTVLVGVKEGVDGLYEGVLANLEVMSVPGTGNVWVTTMPLTKVETQVSARLAREVSCELLGLNCSNFDFFYVLRSDYPLVGGPSAGAAMTVCTLASLLNISLNSGVAMTGTINPDGSIGPVGAVFDKADVLSGYDLFLVPDEGFEIDFNLSVSIVKVSDIIEAFKYYTDYELVPVNVSSEDLVSADYFDSMKMMSESLLYLAREKVNGVDAELLLNKSESYFINESFYSSSSLAVRSLIYSLYNERKDLVNDSLSVKSLIDNVSLSISSFKDEFLSESVIDHFYDIETFAIVLERLKEAESLVSDANDFFNDSLSDALFSECFAEVRLITAKTWSGLLDVFTDSRTVFFDESVIKVLALERLEVARNSIAYAETVIEDFYLFSAKEHLLDSFDAYSNGEFFYSLFESLKARSEANLMMELRGLNNISSRVDFKRESAIRSISNSMSRGFLPLMSLSFFEYSSAFSDEPYQELLFLSYSKEFANLGQLLNYYVNYFNEPASSGYVLVRSVDYSFFNDFLLIFLGFFIGLLVVLLLVYY